MTTRRRIDGAVLSVTVTKSLPSELHHGLELLLEGYPEDHRPADDSLTVASDGAGGFRLKLADGTITEALGQQVTLHLVGEWLDRRSLDLAAATSVHLHAAGFDLADRGWLVVGPSGAGKSTLAFDAVRSGGTYLSDERVTIEDSASGRVSGLTRPLQLRSKPNELVGFPGEQDLVSTGFRTLLPMRALRALGGDVAHGALTITDIVLLTDDVPTRIDPLFASPGWVVLQLINASMDAVRAGPDSVLLLGELAVGSSVFVQRPRSVDSVLELTKQAAPRGGHVRRIKPQAGCRGTSASARIETFDVGGDVIVWVPGEKPVVLLLREERAEWWASFVAGEVDADTCDPVLAVDLAAVGIELKMQPG